MQTNWANQETGFLSSHITEVIIATNYCPIFLERILALHPNLLSKSIIAGHFNHGHVEPGNIFGHFTSRYNKTKRLIIDIYSNSSEW